jgi:hypothetical protein
MVKGIQVLGVLVSLYLIGQTLMQYRKKNYRARRAAFWLSLWILIGVLFAFPSLTILVLPILTTQDAMMTTWVIGLIVGYVLIYQIYQRVVMVERKFTELVQNIAIHNYLEEVKSNPGDKKDEQ